jgi:hypothetical protein
MLLVKTIEGQACLSLNSKRRFKINEGYEQRNQGSHEKKEI